MLERLGPDAGLARVIADELSQFATSIRDRATEIHVQFIVQSFLRNTILGY